MADTETTHGGNAATIQLNSATACRPNFLDFFGYMNPLNSSVYCDLSSFHSDLVIDFEFLGMIDAPSSWNCLVVGW